MPDPQKPHPPGDGKPVRQSPWGWGLLALIVALAAVPPLIWGPVKDGRGGFYGRPPYPARLAYNYEVTDHNGNPLRLDNLRGKAVLMCFGFTSCPDICPTTLTSLDRVHQALPPDLRERVQVVFISVDPKRDTPEKLKLYVPFFNPTFIGATADGDRIKKIADEYNASFCFVRQPTKAMPDYYTVTHSANTYLVDQYGRLALVYGFEQLSDAGKIASDIERILHPSP